ncbi:hypothetical protein V5O48_001161 [Marasmius crinis-equi]|uniref:NACHT domain-containing protein n=1 Tax=Marasmius crinis-equi TaxID=585013 RepID=A0ABR3FZD8_9AGAR
MTGDPLFQKSISSQSGTMGLGQRGRGKLKSGVKNGGEVALMILRATYTVADVFPPLKAVAGAALEIGQTVKRFSSNQREWETFGEYVQEMLARSLPIRKSLNVLMLRTVNGISMDVKTQQAMSRSRRFLLFAKDPEEIVEMRRKLDAALKVFQIECSLSMDLYLVDILAYLQVDNVTKVVEDVNEIVENVNERLVQRLVSSASLEQLPYVKGASWNPNRGCLAGTRQALLAEIMEWSSSKTESADIFLLSGVAGSGKTAISHSVAQLAFESGVLVTSFFFNREDTSLSNPSGLLTTLARDISRQTESLSSAIASAVESDPGLPTAHSLHLQFQKLIVEPLTNRPIHEPLLVVIDALDEGCNEDLLRILRDDVSKIPSPIHFFITSRPTNNITSFVHPTLDHVQHSTIDIHSKSNKEDVALYVRHTLRCIAEDLSLQKTQRHSGQRDSPDSDPSSLTADANAVKLAQKAGGLFIWASTVMNYLSASMLPEHVLLSLLLKKPSFDATNSSRKMDKLYMDILNVLNWADPSFVEGYQLVMGTMVVALTPLSVPVLQSLYSSSRVDVVMIERAIARLGSLLVIPAEPHSPIHLIHLSFREFITTHASVPMLIDEKEHHRRLLGL